MLTTEIGKMGHDMVQLKAEVFIFIIILPHPHQIDVGESDKASYNMTQINTVLGKGVPFSPKADKVCQPFFP